MRITKQRCCFSVRGVHVASQLCYDKHTCTHPAALHLWSAILRIIPCRTRLFRLLLRSPPRDTTRAPGTATPHCTGWSKAQSRSAGRPRHPKQDSKLPFVTSANSSRQKTWPGEYLYAGSPSDSPRTAAAAAMRGIRKALKGGFCMH